MFLKGHGCLISYRAAANCCLRTIKHVTVYQSLPEGYGIELAPSIAYMYGAEPI